MVGAVPAGLPRLRWPEFDPEFIRPLLGGALGVALLSFSNAMVVTPKFPQPRQGMRSTLDQDFSPSAPARDIGRSLAGFAIAEPIHARQATRGRKKPGFRAGGGGNDGSVLLFLAAP